MLPKEVKLGIGKYGIIFALTLQKFSSVSSKKFQFQAGIQDMRHYFATCHLTTWVGYAMPKQLFLTLFFQRIKR